MPSKEKLYGGGNRLPSPQEGGTQINSRNHQEADFIVMKGFITRRAVKNCSERLCEPGSCPCPCHRGSSEGWGEVRALAGKVTSLAGVLSYPAISPGQVTGFQEDNSTLKFAGFW